MSNLAFVEKTRTRVRSHVPPERKPERGYVRQNHPFYETALQCIWKREKAPHTFSLTKKIFQNGLFYEGRISSLRRTPGRFTTRPLPVYFATKFPFVGHLGSLARTKSALRKTGRFLRKAESVGVGGPVGG